VLVGLGMGAEDDLIAYLQAAISACAVSADLGYLFALFTVGTGLGPS